MSSSASHDDRSPPRQQPIRYQPITGSSIQEEEEDMDEAEEESGTVRRRPARQATVEDFARYRPSAQSRSRASSSVRNKASSPRNQSPDKADRPERPRPRKQMSRRASSNPFQPHKGQEFSVDDDQQEVEKDLAARSAYSGSTLKKRPTSIRKPTRSTFSTTLPRVDSELSATRSREDQEGSDTAVERESPAIDEAPQDEDDIDGDDRKKEDSEDDGDASSNSDAESFTLRDKQDAINETHPFGIRIWKPAIYKKDRSVQKGAEGDIHSSPGGQVSRWLVFANVCWCILFGSWLAAASFLGGVACYLFWFAPGAKAYARVLLGLSWYFIYPFNKFVQLQKNEAYLEEDEGEGRSISEYERWQAGDLENGRLIFGLAPNRSLIGHRRDSIDSASETDSLLGRSGASERRDSQSKAKRRFFGRGNWNVGRVVFFIVFYLLIAPVLFLVSGICWLFVFTIPMGRATFLIFDHLKRHPLSLRFRSDVRDTRSGDAPGSIVLCTYRAMGVRYWKYTIDGTNIFFINLNVLVLFVVLDYLVLTVAFGAKTPFNSPAVLFPLSLLSIIPLAYFIGQAVASISAQSSMGMGAAINAFFSTIVEVFLYCVALNQGKARLVEGSVIGSVMAGVLLLPGTSMCFGAIKRKTQRFNAKSAGVTSTMLLFAVIAAFGPTLFYQIYGSYELQCGKCTDGDQHHHPNDSECQLCYFSQVPAVGDNFYTKAVKPFCYFAAVTLFLSYIIGLWFTLRTHAAVIWASGDESLEKEKKHGGDTNHHALSHSDPDRMTSSLISIQSPKQQYANIQDSPLYKRVLGQSLNQTGLAKPSEGSSKAGDRPPSGASSQTVTGRAATGLHIPGLSDAQNQDVGRNITEIAVTAAAVAAQEATRRSLTTHKHPPSISRKNSILAKATPKTPGSAHHRALGLSDSTDAAQEAAEPAAGGHDAPNWSRTKSAIILMGATVLYAIVAEILVNTVDVVLENVSIDEKFLGFTLFALVPNTTEFLNAISFAINGNIALSMEIGSAYALQVLLLQIPALVLYSALSEGFYPIEELSEHLFPLIFPQWDLVVIVLTVFLLSYTINEGKSNYFKGSILVLSYLVVTVGFYLAGFTDHEYRKVETGSTGSQFSTMAVGSRGSRGFAMRHDGL